MTEKQRIKLELERERIAGMRAFENERIREMLGTEAFVVAGIDEAGRGPLAGPVAAGAVILPADHDILYLNDSKKLSAKKRDMLYDQIREEAVAWAVGLVEPARIDEINILQATYEAMRLAISQLKVSPTVLINDAVVIVDGYYNSSMTFSKKVGYAHIHTADYYWITTEIVPAV